MAHSGGHKGVIRSWLRSGFRSGYGGWMAGVALALVLLPALASCGNGQTTLSRVLDILRTDSTPLSAQKKKQLDRFKTVYRAYSTAPDKTERLDYFDFGQRVVVK